MNAATAVRLVVNADDFGYFDEVTRGIVDAAREGVVTATGVMANGPALDRWVDALKALPSVSVGVHLNATLGRPLTAAMGYELEATNGEFPAKGALGSALLLGRISAATLLKEWRAQIEHCLSRGLTLHFLNSHEHVHMLPKLYAQVRQLANEFSIPHVRAPRPEWGGPVVSPAGWFRSSVFAVAKVLVPPPPRMEPLLIGLAPSGRLDKTYCEWRFPRLARGAAYELMCHPGWTDETAQRNPKLGAYHDWEGELHTLLSADFQRLLRKHEIELTSFSGLRDFA
jgi:chitin disaccharide deacetylase